MSGVPGEPLNVHQVRLVAVCTLCITLSTTVIGLRLLARRVSLVKYWWDDGLASFALVVSWIPNIFTLAAIHLGMGRHASELSKQQLKSFGILFFIHELGWAASMGVTIASILLFYIRLFPSSIRWVRWTVYGLGMWTAAWTTSTFLVFIFQCHPVAFFWNGDYENGRCINANAMYFAASLISTLTILTVLILPLPVTSKLQTSRSKRIGLAFSFSTGIFVLISSVVRMIVLLQIDRKDITWSSVSAQLWSCVECSFGVISACIPSITPLFHIIRGKTPGSRRQSGESPLNSSRRRSSAMKSNSRASRVIDYDPASPTKPNGASLHRESILDKRSLPRSPDEDLFKEIDEMYPGMVLTQDIDQDLGSRSDTMTEKTVDVQHVPV